MIGENTILSVAEGNFLLSRAKAKQRLKREGYPSSDQIIQRAKAKVDWPDERWDEIRRIANATDKPDMLVVSHKTDFAHILQCHRWVAAASSLVLILTALLICIPESRAFAIQVYYSVIRLFDNRVEVQQPTQTHVWGEYDSQIANDFASELEKEYPQKQEMQTFTSLQEFEKATGHIPYRLNAPDITYETSKFQRNRRNEEWLFSYYQYKGSEIVTTQLWNPADSIENYADESFSEYDIGDGKAVYYAIDKYDQSKYGILQLDDSILTIHTTAVISISEFLELFSKQ